MNAVRLAAMFVDTLPQATRTPETTDGRQGFIHLYEMTGTAGVARIGFILRDFERDDLAAHGALVTQVAAAVAAPSPAPTVEVTITPQYRNMRYWLETDMRPVELVREAMPPGRRRALLRADPRRHRRLPPDRDGRPCPNVFTGMQMIHGPLEWVSVQDMSAATRVCIRLAELWGAGEGRYRDGRLGFGGGAGRRIGRSGAGVRPDANPLRPGLLRVRSR